MVKEDLASSFELESFKTNVILAAELFGLAMAMPVEVPEPDCTKTDNDRSGVDAGAPTSSIRSPALSENANRAIPERL